MEPIIHLLIIDDDRRIRQLLGKFLTDRGYFVTMAEDAFVAREKLQTFRFDLIIVDVMMPGETGFDFTRTLRQSNDTPVIMLTAMGEVDDRITGLESGADDYLPKPFEPRELLLRIQRILARTRLPETTQSVRFGSVTFQRDTSSLIQDGTLLPLTSGEAQLLALLCQKPGSPITREELAKQCGGINERSVDVQITRLRQKLEPDPKKPRYVKTIRGKGYVLYSD